MQITETIRALTESRDAEPRRGATPLPNFGGEKQEDPEMFLSKLEKYFDNYKIKGNDEKLAIFSNQLIGDARTWRIPYNKLEETYEEVRQRFLSHFNSVEKVSSAMAVLYGEKQQRNEKVIPFIIKKQGLMMRLVPNMREEEKVELVINQLNIEIRSRIRGGKFNNVEELRTIAAQVEEDLEELKTMQQPSREPAQRNVNFRREGASPATGRRPPHPCRYCGQQHYHSECQQNPHRPGQVNNERRTEERNNEVWN